MSFNRFSIARCCCGCQQPCEWTDDLFGDPPQCGYSSNTFFGSPGEAVFTRDQVNGFLDGTHNGSHYQSNIPLPNLANIGGFAIEASFKEITGSTEVGVFIGGAARFGRRWGTDYGFAAEDCDAVGGSSGSRTEWVEGTLHTPDPEHDEALLRLEINEGVASGYDLQFYTGVPNNPFSINRINTANNVPTTLDMVRREENLAYSLGSTVNAGIYVIGGGRCTGLRVLCNRFVCFHCNDFPALWLISPSGIANGTSCTVCANYNGNFELDHIPATANLDEPGGCRWATTIPNPGPNQCDLTGGTSGSPLWRLRYDTTVFGGWGLAAHGWKNVGGVATEYEIAVYKLSGTFNCLGNNTFNLDSFDSAQCTNWPSSLTATPQLIP